MAQQREQLQWVEVDLDQIKVTGKVSELDPTEDAWEFAAPPPKGVYDIKLYPAKGGWKMANYDKNDPEAVYFQGALEGRIVSNDPDVNDTVVFIYVSTRIARGKKISTMAGMVAKAGFKCPPSATDVQIAKLFRQVLKKEPVLKGLIDWRGAYKDPEGNYVNACNTYADFPTTKDGKGREHIFSKQTKEHGVQEIRAQLTVTRWFGKDEKIDEGKLDKVKFAEPSKLDLEEPELAPISASPVVASGGKTNSKATDDLDLVMA
jgi:hypothetical protein